MDTVSVLALAFALGMLHALDADHVMAVSGLAATQSRAAQCLRFCLRWGLGHGATMLLIGCAVILLGMTIPDRLSALAESAVAVVLVLIGLWVFWDLSRQRAHIHFHQHDASPGHAHWHRHRDDAHSSHASPRHAHGHGALLVGMLHGAAGAAPLLVLLPLASSSSPMLALAYLLLFCVGVLGSMLIFGGLLSRVYDKLASRGTQAARALRAIVALSALALGLHLAGMY